MPVFPRFGQLFRRADGRVGTRNPGGHGNLGPISPAIIAFFTKNLKGSAAEPTFTPMRPAQTADLIVTPTGQVSNSIGGETVHSINRKRAEALFAPQLVLSGKADVQKLQTRLRQDIRTLTGSVLQPGASNSLVAVKGTEQRDGYRIDTISLRSDGDTEVPGFVAIPDGTRARPALLMMDSQAVPDGEIDRLTKAGRIVMALEPRPTPPGAESIKSPYLGGFNLLSLRAFLVGKTIIGLRMDDAIRAVDWLAARKDVDRNAIAAYGNGPHGMVLLHAAALDSRIARLTIENTLISYRMIVDQPVHRNVSEVVIPGVLRHYDTGDLLEAIYPRPVVILSPKDALGAAISEQDFRTALTHVMQSEQKLGSTQRIRFALRVAGGPLPLD